MRILVTGASGLLGNSLVYYLVNKKNTQVTALWHKHKPRLPAKVKLMQADIVNSSGLDNACKNIDIIIHCAAVINGSSRIGYLEVNYQGSVELLRAAREAGVKQFIYISSWSANRVGGNYALSKHLAEEEVKNFSNYLIIRPADIYSKTGSHLHNYIATIRKLPLIPVFGKGDYKVSPVFIDDLVKTIVKISENYQNRTYTITGPEIYTFVEFNKLIMKKLNFSKPILHIPRYPALIIVRLLEFLRIPFFMDTEQLVRLTSNKILPTSTEKALTRGFLPFESALEKFVF